MFKSADCLIKFIKFISILGVYPCKCSYLNGTLFFEHSPRLNYIFYLRLGSCCSHCVFLLCRSIQYALNPKSFTRLEGTFIFFWFIVYSFIFVFLVNTFFHIDELVRFSNQISKFCFLRRQREEVICSDVDARFIMRLAIAFGIASTLHTPVIVWIFLTRPTLPNYIFSVVPAPHLSILLIPFTIYEIFQYVGNWCAIIFYVLFSCGYLSISASWLAQLR